MNWIYKKFKTIEKTLEYVNAYDIQKFGIVNDVESFWGGYILIYKK